MPPPTVRVIALKAFTHEGRPIVPGFVDLTPVDASLLARRGLVNLSIPSAKDSKATIQKQLAASRARKRPTTRAGRQQYRTRHLTAEGTENK